MIGADREEEEKEETRRGSPLAVITLAAARRFSFSLWEFSSSGNR
jgi:hypothetical protein